MIVTRFAPSPNGSLHLGHAYSAIVAHDLAHEAGGRFLVRVEDIDGARSQDHLVEQFWADLEWLGLSWECVPAQSSRLESYLKAAEQLRAMGLLYPCQCTRAQIMATDPVIGPDGPIYPGTCKHVELDEDGPVAWRLDMQKAMQRTGPLSWEDNLAGPQQMQADLLGDVVLVRKDEPASYHLASVVDDAADGVTLVTRGADLFSASHLHRLLQALLDLPVPRWHHHRLLFDASGRKLAKRRGSPSLADRREAGEDGVLLGQQLRLQAFPSGISLQPH